MNQHVRLSDRPAARVDLSGAFIRRTDLSYANLEGANFSSADCTNANFRGANLKNAILDHAILRGADLTDVKNLTREQLGKAIIDETTMLPDYLR
jgi:uncharacterized protein YjbI with pentapeptide repeats